MDGKSWIVLRVDPVSTELDKDTTFILDHLRWTTTKGPNRKEASIGEEDILVDITVPALTDTQTCGLRVLQYHAIIGSIFAQHPEVLREGGAVLQQFIQETVLTQLQQVNRETTEQYYQEMRQKLQHPEWEVPLRTHQTWPDIQNLPRKRKPSVSCRKVNNHNWHDQMDRKELR